MRTKETTHRQNGNTRQSWKSTGAAWCAALAMGALWVGCNRTAPPQQQSAQHEQQDQLQQDPQPGPLARVANAIGLGPARPPQPTDGYHDANAPQTQQMAESHGRRADGRYDAAPRQPVRHEWVLSAGAPIRVRTTSTISTKSHCSGQEFYGSLADPLVVDGAVIAPRGSEVVGRIVNADPGGRVKGVARITLALSRVTLASGDTISVDTSRIGRSARATKKKDALKIGIGSGVGAAIGAIAGGGKGAAIGAASGGGAGTGWVLATRGEPAVVPAESLLTFTTRETVSGTL